MGREQAGVRMTPQVRYNPHVYGVARDRLGPRCFLPDRDVP